MSHRVFPNNNNLISLREWRKREQHNTIHARTHTHTYTIVNKSNFVVFVSNQIHSQIKIFLFTRRTHAWGFMCALYFHLQCVSYRFCHKRFNNKRASDWYYEKIKIESEQPGVKRRDIHLISTNMIGENHAMTNDRLYCPYKESSIGFYSEHRSSFIFPISIFFSCILLVNTYWPNIVL